MEHLHQHYRASENKSTCNCRFISVAFLHRRGGFCYWATGTNAYRVVKVPKVPYGDLIALASRAFISISILPGATARISIPGSLADDSGKANRKFYRKENRSAAFT